MASNFSVNPSDRFFKFDPSQQKHQEALINAIAEMTGLGSEIKLQEGRYAIFMK